MMFVLLNPGHVFIAYNPKPIDNQHEVFYDWQLD
jgi:hypothetical protein